MMDGEGEFSEGRARRTSSGMDACARGRRRRAASMTNHEDEKGLKLAICGLANLSFPSWNKIEETEAGDMGRLGCLSVSLINRSLDPRASRLSYRRRRPFSNMFLIPHDEQNSSACYVKSTNSLRRRSACWPASIHSRLTERLK